MTRFIAPLLAVAAFLDVVYIYLELRLNRSHRETPKRQRIGHHFVIWLAMICVMSPAFWQGYRDTYPKENLMDRRKSMR
jgi:hypothetical protein